MMQILNLFAGLLLALSGLVGVHAQTADEGAEGALDQLDWIAGEWREVREDAASIHIRWDRVGPGSMVGTWSISREGQVVAYEMLTMIEDAAGVHYRFDLYRRANGFENPSTTDLVLVEAGERWAKFEGQFGGDGPVIWIIMEETPTGELYGYSVLKSAPDDTPLVGYRAARVD